MGKTQGLSLTSAQAKSVLNRHADCTDAKTRGRPLQTGLTAFSISAAQSVMGDVAPKLRYS